MKRLAFVIILAALTVAAPATAARGSGEVYYETGSIGCGFAATSSDGTAFGAFGGFQVRFVGGTSLVDRRIGWSCTGNVALRGLPLPATGSVTISGLVCKVIGSIFSPTVGGTLEKPGSVSLYANGDVTMTCPPSKR